MSGGAKRNEDSINTIGIVVVGICGAVMVYVSITALQAFYMNDTSELQTMADYGGQDTTAKSHKAAEVRSLTEPAIGTNAITIDRAMSEIVKAGAEAKAAGKPLTLTVPAACDENFPTEIPQPGRPVVDPGRTGGCKGGKVTPKPADGSASGAAAGSGAGSDSRSNAGSGSDSGKGKGKGKGTGSGDTGANIPLHSTNAGAAGDTHAVGGASGAPAGKGNGSAVLAPGGHAP